MNAEQEQVVGALGVAAAKRDEAEVIWRARVKQVDKLLNRAAAVGVPTSEVVKAAKVSRQYLWKRASKGEAA